MNIVIKEFLLVEGINFVTFFFIKRFLKARDINFGIVVRSSVGVGFLIIIRSDVGVRGVDFRIIVRCSAGVDFWIIVRYSVDMRMYSRR